MNILILIRNYLLVCITELMIIILHSQESAYWTVPNHL